MTGHRDRWEIRSREEGGAGRGGEDAERPAQLAGEGACLGQITGVDRGVFFPINLDAHHVLVEIVSNGRVAERLSRHDVAPVTGGITDRDENRDVACGGFVERFLAPFSPIDRVVPVCAQVRAHS
jgi:hypothetical protein